MNWSLSAARTSQIVPAYMDRLAQQLQDLTVEVRTSVAGLAGDAIGRAVRDVLLSFWQKSSNRMTRRPDAYDWSREEYDEDESTWEERPDGPDELETSTTGPIPALALLLQAAAWFVQNGTLLGLVGTGIGLGSLALLSRRLMPSSNLVNGIADAASLLILLNSGANHLRSR